jgi:hypothetical protein
MGHRFFIDLDALTRELESFKEEIEYEVNRAAQNTALATHAKAIELADQKLNTTKMKFINNLKYEEIAEGTWVVSLLKPMVWRDEGLDAYDMRNTLLKSGYKTSKDGARYKAIPFEHSKNPSEQSSQAKFYTDLIRKELKKRNIPYKKIELNPNGSPRLGRLHSFNIPSERPARKSGQVVASHPALHGVTIYQREGEGGKVRRDVMTFRTISDNSPPEKWHYPGLEGAHIMDECFEWAMATFDTEILPQIFEKYGV